MQVIPFLPEHGHQVVGNAVEVISGWDNGKVIQEYYEGGPAFTGLNEAGEVVGCAGIVVVGSGVGSAWAIVDREKVHTVPTPEIYGAIRHHLPLLMKQYGFRRVQADCVAGIPVLERFAINAGFTREGVLRKFGRNGEDHIFFSLVEGDI